MSDYGRFKNEVLDYHNKHPDYIPCCMTNEECYGSDFWSVSVTFFNEADTLRVTFAYTIELHPKKDCDLTARELADVVKKELETMLGVNYE